MPSYPSRPQRFSRTAAKLAVFLGATLSLVPWSSRASASPSLELVADGLVAPISIQALPDKSRRQVVLDQSGVIWLLQANGKIAAQPFLDLRSRLLKLDEGFEERGLLGMAVHPSFSNNGRLFVSYTAPLDADAPANWNYTRIVSEFTINPDDPSRLNPDSERILIRLHWPSRKHNGGALAFGPNGFLHIGFGDAGGVHGVGPKVLNDAFKVPKSRLHWDTFAQDTQSLYGKMLRIDVDRGYPGYAIPSDNPFVGKPGRDEIYAWGFRNPYRIAFDPINDGSYFLTAVAETFWESVYQVKQPGNFGWPLREGTHCFDRTQPLKPPADCARHWPNSPNYPVIDPIVEYPNMSVHRDGSAISGPGVGTAIVGAVMLRGEKPSLLFADWSLDFRKPSGQLFLAQPKSAPGLWAFKKVMALPTRVVSLSVGLDDQVFVLTNENLGPYGKTGKIFRLSVAP